MTLLLLWPPDAVASAGDTPGLWHVRPERRLLARVSSSLAGANQFAPGGEILGSWHDATRPSFDVSFAGAGPCNLELARAWNTPDPRGMIQSFRRVDLYVSDTRSLRGPWPSRHIYRGTIEDIEAPLDSGMTRLAVLPLTRILNASYISLTTLSGDAVTVVRDLVSAYGGGLSWDDANPTIGGITIPFFTKRRQSLGAIVEAIAAVMGPAWHIWVTPQGTVAMREDAALDTVVHELTAGVEAVEIVPAVSILDYCTRVVIIYTPPGGAPTDTIAVADDYNMADPRDWIETLPGETPASFAASYAAARLREKHVRQSAGSCRVLASRYPIETLDVGHLVSLRIEQSRAQPNGLAGWNPTGLRIAQIQYDWDSATISFETPQRNIVDTEIQRAERWAALFRAA